MEFGIANPPQSGEKKKFKYEVDKEITIGKEGEKCIAEVESSRGKHGKYFIKWSNGEIQVEKHKFLKDNGVAVPKVFKNIKGESSFPMILATDLSEDGKYEVLSTNNHEVYSQDYAEKVAKISQETRSVICDDLLHAAEVGAGVSRTSEDEHVYILIPNAYALVLDPANPDGARLVVIDYGMDVWKLKPDHHYASNSLNDNIRYAAAFYAAMLLEKMRLPEKYSSMQEMADAVGEKIINDRASHMHSLERTGHL